VRADAENLLASYDYVYFVLCAWRGVDCDKLALAASYGNFANLEG